MWVDLLIIMKSELDKHPQHVFSVSGTRIKCITEHESFRPVCLLADVKAETYSFRGGSSSLSFLFIVVSLFFTWMAFFWRWTMLGLEHEWLNVVLWVDSQIWKWIVTFSRFCAAVAVVRFFLVGHLCLMRRHSLVWNQDNKDGGLLWKKLRFWS